MLHAKQPSQFNKLRCIVIKRSNCPLFCPIINFLHGGGQVIGIGKKVRQNEKQDVMDLIKYMPYTRATPQSLLKRTEGLLTIKKIMSYGVNGVSYLKERRARNSDVLQKDGMAVRFRFAPSPWFADV